MELPQAPRHVVCSHKEVLGPQRELSISLGFGPSSA